MIEPTKCPECEASVIETDNGVRLDFPAVEWHPHEADWTLMIVGAKPLVLACAGVPGANGKGFSMHEHQPEEGTT